MVVMWFGMTTTPMPFNLNGFRKPLGFYTILEALRNRNSKSGINHGARRILNFYLSFSHDSSTYKIVLNYDFGKKIEYSKKTSSWAI